MSTALWLLEHSLVFNPMSGNISKEKDNRILKRYFHSHVY